MAAKDRSSRRRRALAASSAAIVALSASAVLAWPATGYQPDTRQGNVGECTSDSNGVIQVTLPAGQAFLSTVASGEVFLGSQFGGEPCEVTVSELRGGTVVGTEGNDSFVVDNGGPGGSFQGDFSVDLGSGNDALGVSGTNGADLVRGQELPSLEELYRLFVKDKERANEFVVDAEAAENLVVLFTGGLDIFGVKSGGAEPRGAPIQVPMRLDGGAGADRLTAGGADDQILGRGGRDRLAGGGGADLLDGGGGKDDCSGGPGKDTEKRCE
jgi:hypothetical protein